MRPAPPRSPVHDPYASDAARRSRSRARRRRAGRLLAAAGAAVLATGCGRLHAQRLARERPAELLVEVLPRSAEIRLDGRVIGRGSALLGGAAVPLGGRVLAFTAPGFLREEQVLPEMELAGARLGAALRPEGFPGPPIALDDAPALAAAADFLARAGRAGDAREYVERALALEPGLAVAHRVLGDVRARLGERRGAVESWEAYLRLAPEAMDAAVVARRIAAAQEAEPRRGP